MFVTLEQFDVPAQRRAHVGVAVSLGAGARAVEDREIDQRLGREQSEEGILVLDDVGGDDRDPVRHRCDSMSRR
jgi:hypothetical protein